MICRMTEMQFYDKADKHQIAYRRLANERSRSIVKLLGFKDNDATTVDACLRCHALPEVGGGRMNTAFLSEGVTCVACHGPYREWVGEHPDAVVFLGLQKPPDRARNAPKNWLELTRKEKEELKGMTDLWDPVRRSEICASCHIGNYKEKKVITHAMYAAGHPPLPGFEAATFSEFQPRHWQYLGEKEKSQRDRLRPFDESNLERALLVAISGPIVLRESMRLFAEQARGNRDERSGAAWPDFARYDCRACHHELKSEAKVTSRGGPVGLGRPAAPWWTHALVRFGILICTANAADATNEQMRYEALAKSFRAAMSAEPFGNRGPVVEAAEDLANWADELVKNRPHTAVDQKRAWTMLAELCDESATKGLDYDSARQIGWAFLAIYHDVRRGERQKDGDKEIERILNQLDSGLFLTFNSPGKEQGFIEDSLKTRLGFAARYNAAATAELFAQLKRLVARH
jgi:hypothetical protein